ncbi:uncharacterized protein [Dendrobates tinctorius]|uniref:uncharacterized protein n=1 Tax=Dendrobates tinctorius TaxID=92724 RepID=UPI003CC9CC00
MTLTKAPFKGQRAFPGLPIPATQCPREGCIILYLTIDNPSEDDQGLYILGSSTKAGRAGEGDRMGKFRLRNLESRPPTEEIDEPVPGAKFLLDLTYEERLAIETGFSDSNVWLERVKYTATNANRSSCIACTTARPHLGTVPFPINPWVDEKGFLCALSLYMNNQPGDSQKCQSISHLYPPHQSTEPTCHGITPYPGNYSCFQRDAPGRQVDNLPSNYCNNQVIQVQEGSLYNDSLLVGQIYQLSDVYWLCGDMKIRPRLTVPWKGQCPMVKALMPFHIFDLPGWDQVLKENHLPKREKRELQGSFDPHIYIDSIGVPKGVPNEFKAKNEVAAGFESIIPMIGVNKNVKWINYLYYNQQRFVNFTRYAIWGLIEQLGPASIMAFQNRMALDMILAEKGGVCKMIGTSCYTYIPTNTAPYGSISRALKGLTDLSEELAQNSGVRDQWNTWWWDG